MSGDGRDERAPVTPGDLVSAGEMARVALAQLSDVQWQARAEPLAWTRDGTAVHICGALQFYATQLAVRSAEYTETVRLDSAAMNTEALPDLVHSQSTLLAQVAVAAPGGARAWHPSGSPDAEGFLAMGCAEVLLHAWDCLSGTTAEFQPDEGLADRVTRRLFPWTPLDTPRWESLLWATGRGDLTGHESPGDNWKWHNPPLDEWDGQEKRRDR